jgi:hypothetical protein
MAEGARIDWRLFWIMYGLILAIFVARVIFNASTIPLISDTDDAMRLVVVRDFLAGQGWYDNVQHRLNTPFGAEIHWSRLPDLPLGGLILALRPLLGATGDVVAAFVLPLAWLFVMLYLTCRVTLMVAAREAVLPALALPAFSLTVLGEFAPGRIDHHSLQIILALAMLLCSIEALKRPRFAVGAGLSAATALAIGIEALPMLVATILAFGLIWVFKPERADALRLFGLSAGLGTFAHLLLALPPERWLAPACDAISIVYALPVVLAGAAFVLLSLLPLGAASPRLRLAAGVAAGAAVVAVVALLFPDCLRGPYASLDPWLVENWIAGINEALPLLKSLTETDPVYPLAVAAPPLLALIVVVLRITRRAAVPHRAEWLVYGFFLALAIVAMLIQIRASRIATALAVPAGAWLIVAARQWYLERKSLLRATGLLASWVLSAGVAVGVVASLAVAALPGDAAEAVNAETKSRRQCLMPSAFAELAAFPPERLMTPFDLGSHILAFTPHHVVAAPYHRNERGVLDAFAFFNGPIDEAREILKRRGVTLVVVCPGMPEMKGRRDAAPDSFVRLRQAGKLPAWLVDQTLPGAPLEVYAAMPD